MIAKNVRQTVSRTPIAQHVTPSGAHFQTNMIIPSYRDDVRQITILNPKGGCGKTTLATNLASYFALYGSRPMLIDNDPKGYSSRWLDKRPGNSCKIHGISRSNRASSHVHDMRPRIPGDTDTVIIDTPAALDRHQIAGLTKNADCILVPILPSAFDTHVATSFIADLLILTQFEKPVAVVANRTRKNTKSLAMLMRVLASLETPTISVLRDSQNYVYAAANGLGIYEMPDHRVRQDVEQMDLIVSWLDQLLSRTWLPLQPSPLELQANRVTPLAAISHAE